MNWQKLKNRFFPDEYHKSIKRWFKDKGDMTLRLDYPLSSESLVFDLGGYEGQWTADIFQRYRCSVFVFEPVLSYYEKIATRFADNPSIQVFPFGLSNATQECEISLAKEGSSIYKKGQNCQTTKLVCAQDFMVERSIRQVDLMKINIEGGEYDLLDHLISTGFVNMIQDIQVQFHDVPEIHEVKERMHAIQKQLSETHELTYQYYPFIWENWRHK